MPLPMTVVVNAVAAKMGGAATYLRALARELAQTPESERYIFYVPPEQAKLEFLLPPHIQWRVTHVSHRGTLARLGWDQVTLRRWLRGDGASVLYSTASFAMFACPVPQLLLVQNALHFSSAYRSLILPQKPWPFRLSFALRTWLARASLREATAVMVPSQALLDEIRASGVGLPGRVLVNHFGTPPPAATGSSPAGNTGGRKSFRLLYPGLYTEHKNLVTVLRAVKRLREQNHLDVEFVTTADPASEPARGCVTTAADLARARDPTLAGAVRFLTPLSPPAVAPLYAECDAVIYPTLVESFGHPLVEALAHGLPVVASDIPVNRELGGTVPLYFQPLDPADLADKVARLAGDPALRARLSAAGRERARAYTWSAHLTRLRTLLAEVAGQSR